MNMIGYFFIIWAELACFVSRGKPQTRSIDGYPELAIYIIGLTKKNTFFSNTFFLRFETFVPKQFAVKIFFALLYA